MLPLALVITAAVGVWFGLIVVFPRKWAALVDREYDFLVRRGLMPKTLSNRVKRMETGGGIRLAVGALFLVYLFLSVMLLSLRA